MRTLAVALADMDVVKIADMAVSVVLESDAVGSIRDARDEARPRKMCINGR
jgi:hypothetical protein